MTHFELAATNPRKAALAFQLLLAAERGYTSTLRTVPSGSILLTASDGKTVRFTKGGR